MFLLKNKKKGLKIKKNVMMNDPKSELTVNMEGEAWPNGLKKLVKNTGKIRTKSPASAPPLPL